MKRIIHISASFNGLLIVCLLAISTTGCKKYLEIPLPATKIAAEGAYSTDRSSAATVNNILATLTNGPFFNGASSIGYTTGLYTDEFSNINPNNPTNLAYYTDAVVAANTGAMWSTLYKQIYNANLTIEGVTASNTLTYKQQWLGEAYFLRALCYFYLTNYYGDVVIATSSDYTINKDLARSPKTEAYKLIVADLIRAQGLLSNDYKDATGITTTSKGRPNKLTATALLARTYLYTGDWVNAEAQANSVISSGTYTLLPATDIDKVFLAASAETIFNFVSTTFNQDYNAYNANMLPVIPYNNLSWNGIAASVSPSLLGAFEKNAVTLADDRRKTYWLRASTMSASTTTPVVPAQVRYFPNKYKSTVIGAENIVMFRLAEQYLIRAEARAMQNNLTGAEADIDMIRNRAGLTAGTAGSQADMIKAIMQERRIEFFSEEGNRFFDLKRTGTIDAVMNVVAPAKGVGAKWNSFKQYFPITSTDVLANPKLTQTPGYQ